MEARGLLAPALRVALGVAAVATAAYVAAVLLADPRGLDVWLLLAPTLFAAPVTGVYAALLTAARRYYLAILRVPLATAIALVAFSLFHVTADWHSTAALALAISAGQVAMLVLLAFETHRAREAETDGGGARSLLPARSLLAAAGSVFLATLIGGQLFVVLERFLASTLAAGAVTLLVFARGFALLPIMLPQALASGIFPAASERHKDLDRDALATLAARSIRLGVLAALVSAAFVVISRRELVQVAIERGELGEGDAADTARLIVIMAFALVGIAAASIAGKALFAVGRQRVVALVSAAGIAAYLAAALLLREREGVDGLAAAFSFSSLLTGVALAAYLARVLDLRAGSLVLDWLLAPSLLAAAFAAGAVPAWLLLGGSDDFWPSLATIGAVGVAGAATLTAAIVAARGYEYELLRTRLAH